LASVGVILSSFQQLFCAIWHGTCVSNVPKMTKN
jgi:hypothetical protein